MNGTTSFVNAQIEDDRVKFLYRDDEGVLKVKTLPAEYVSYHPVELSADPATNIAMWRAMRKDRRVLGVEKEGDFYRVRWRGKWERRDVCKGMRDAVDGKGNPRPIPVLEGDVNPIRRYISDHGLGIAKPRRLFFDIETDSRVNFAQSRMGEARMLSWAAIDEHHNEFTAVLKDWSDDAERVLLEAWWALADRGEIHPCVEITRDEGKTVLKHRGFKLADDNYDLDHGGPLSQTLHECEHGYDQLIAWSGRHGDETYDFVVLEKRSRRVGAMPKDISRFLWLDHHDVFERMNKNSAESGEEKQSLKLQDVGMALLGHGKDDFDPSKTYEAWEAGGKERRRLVKYNLKDVRLMIQIEEKSGYIQVFQALCEACGIFPTTFALYPTVQMDGFMLRLGAQRNAHFRTKYYDLEEDRFPKEQFEGAFVLHPKIRGIVQNVHVGDFASMYPSIIITWNMSPDTKLGVFPKDECPPNSCWCPSTGVCFTTTKQGILAFAINEMLRLREYWRKRQSELAPGTPEWVDAGRRSTAYKVAANSFFGAMGNRYSRYYDEEIAESITTNGAWLSRNVMERAESKKWNIEPIYGDTDALMARGVNRTRFVEFVDYCNAKLFPKLLKDVGCVENRIKFENEKGYKRIAFMLKSGSKTVLAAKRYVGIYDYYKKAKAGEDSEPEIKGLAWRRGDTNSMGRDLQWDIIQHFRSDKTYKKVAQYIETVLKWKKKTLEEKLTAEEVKVSASLTKELDEYVVRKKKNGEDGAQSPHIRVGKMLRARGQEAMLGTRIEYYVKDHPSRTVLPISDYDGQCDRYYLWEDKVFKPTLSLLEAMFPTDNWKEYHKARPRKERKGRVNVIQKDSAAKGNRRADGVEVGGGEAGKGAGLQRRGVVPGNGLGPGALRRGKGSARRTDGPAQGSRGPGVQGGAHRVEGLEGNGNEARPAGKPSRPAVRRRGSPATNSGRVTRGTAYDVFPCGVCGDDVDQGEPILSGKCSICESPITLHEFPCSKAGGKNLQCFACKNPTAKRFAVDVPKKKKKVVVT